MVSERQREVPGAAALNSRSCAPSQINSFSSPLVLCETRVPQNNLPWTCVFRNWPNDRKWQNAIDAFEPGRSNPVPLAIVSLSPALERVRAPLWPPHCGGAARRVRDLNRLGNRVSSVTGTELSAVAQVIPSSSRGVIGEGRPWLVAAMREAQDVLAPVPL